ncbi:AsmA-like C-terminal region-containing protein [Pseudoroseicyclus aestuarii]|uniref:AsmA-like protein n=1 Tax=Pseudoroseicyclus aestuarii TaxID=1795041 RepID=A0A318T5W7_9RHOB|nr:AsmA-like C-terminal region-containing protein [Pseudoroseicyclus aestuarii]PYE85794.1 AsmA-like protein [Pseudoroseicyclus aestuarii]
MQQPDTESSPSEGAAPTGPERRRDRRRARRIARARWRPLRRVLAALLVLPVVLMLVLPFLLLDQELRTPSWLRDRIEAQAGRMLAGGSLTFDEITVTLRRDLHPVVRLRGVELRDAEGRRLARVPRIEAQISPRGLLLEREFLVQEAVLRGAEISLARDEAGRIGISFDTGPGESPAAGAAPSEAPPAGPEANREATGLSSALAEGLARIDRLTQRPALAALERLQAEGLVLNYLDARVGRSWTVDGGTLDIDLTRGTRASARLAILSGRSSVTGLGLAYDRPEAEASAQVSVTLDEVYSGDVASQSPALSWLAAIDAPLSAAIRGSITPEGGLGPFSASLEIGEGHFGAEGVDVPEAVLADFSGAQVNLAYDPARAALDFSRIAVDSDWGRIEGVGAAWLRDVQAGWPASLVAQLDLSTVSLNPAGLYPEPVALRDGWAELRLRTAPLTLEIGSVGMIDDESGARLSGQGRIDIGPGGWDVALEGAVDAVPLGRALQFWPETLNPGARRWAAENIGPEARITDLAAALRLDGDGPMLAMTHSFSGASIRALRGMPPIEEAAGTVSTGEGRFGAMLEAGWVAPPEGGRIDLAGSSFTIPDGKAPRRPAQVDLRAEGGLTAVLSLLDQQPLTALSRAGQGVDLATGQASVSGQITLPLEDPRPEEIVWDMAGALTQVESTTLVPDRSLTAERLEAQANNEGLRIEGPVRIGAAALDGLYIQPFDGTPGRVEGTATLNQALLEEFGVVLPEGSVSGAAQAAVRLDLATEPRLTANSNLAGVALALPQIGWSKPAGTPGSLSLEVALADPPRVERLALEAPGLSASGDVTLTPGGQLDRARFSRLQVGGWLDAPVTLRGRGPDAAIGIEIAGGALDLGRAQFGEGGGEDGGPIEVALDDLRVADGIGLTEFRGSFDGQGGLSGRFDARVNGGTPITGLVVPDRRGTAVRVQAADAGAALRDTGLFATARGGRMDLTLRPEGAAGTYDGSLTVSDIRLRDAPVMAQLLDAVSVVGLLQQLDGQGLVFDDVEADFRLTPETVTLRQASATGPGLGISLDGVYTFGSQRMDFQGVLSPFYFLNQLGEGLTRAGEGLLGVTFTLGGTPARPRVSANPLSALAPGALRDLFRRQAPVAP